MMPFRTLALATLLIVACSRDSSRNAADSLPSMDSARPATSAIDTPPRADTTAPPADSALTGGRITVERAVVNGILWGASGEEVRGLLGQPQTTNTVWEEALSDSATVLQYPGMSVRLVERRVVGLHCTSQSCITGDAVRVGATRAEVEQVYGKGQEEGSGANAHLDYPFTTDDSCALRFELGQGRVRAIDVSCHMN
jgi:hypothetical protein